MKPGLGLSTRYGIAWAQGLLRLFSAGAVIVEAHNLFLRYYAREWAGIEFSGVNGCRGEDMIANGDLIGGQTFCNQPLNFFPWVVLYMHHPWAAALYYGVAAVVIVIIGLGISAAQRRLAGATPYGGPPRVLPPSDSEHLR